MAGLGPTIRLTFAGDASGLGRALREAAADTESFRDTVDRGSKAIGMAGVAMVGSVAGASLATAGALAAVPAAFAVLGIKAAAESQKVKDAFTSLKDDVSQKMQQMAAPLVPVLTGIAADARELFDAIAPAIERIFAKLGPMISTVAAAVMDFVQNAMPGFEAAFNAAGPVVDAIAAGLSGMGTAVGEFFTNLSGGADGAAAGVTALFDAINWLLPALGSMLGWLINNSNWLLPLGGILLAVSGALKVVTAAQAAWNLVMSLNPIGLVVIAIGLLVGAFIYLWNNVEGFRNFFIGVWDTLKSAAATGAQWVVDKARGIADWFRNLPGMIRSAVGNLGSLLLGAGRDLLTGLWNGIVGAAGWLRDRIFGFFGSLLPGWAKDILGIASPSKVFAELGKYIPAGMAVGIEGNLGPVRDASAQMSAAAIPGGNPATTAAATAGGGGGAAVTFRGNVSDPLARLIQQMIRTGQIQITAG